MLAIYSKVHHIYDNMFDNRESFEIYKASVLDVTPLEAVEIKSRLMAEIEQRLSTAAILATTVAEVHADDSQGIWYKYMRHNNIDTRFGEQVFPVVRDDVLSFFQSIQKVTGIEDPEQMWAELVHPNRDVSDGHTEYINQPRDAPFHDIYPVFLLNYDRKNRDDFYDNILPEIDEHTAVVDLVSLKTYLAWLNDRELTYDDELQQHLSPKSRILWEAFIAHVEAITGETLSVDTEVFGYFDSASDFLLHREKGRRIVEDERLRHKNGMRRPLTSAEVYRLNLPLPPDELSISRGLVYVPSGGPPEDQDSSYVSIKDFLDSGVQASIKGYYPATVFYHTVCNIASLDSDSAGVSLYVDRIFGPEYGSRDFNWSKSRLWISLPVLEDWFMNVARTGQGKLGPKERMLIATLLGQVKRERSMKTGVRVTDPADSAEVNLDDPDLN